VVAGVTDMGWPGAWEVSLRKSCDRSDGGSCGRRLRHVGRDA
jgi:hypothetical protein